MVIHDAPAAGGLGRNPDEKSADRRRGRRSLPRAAGAASRNGEEEEARACADRRGGAATDRRQPVDPRPGRRRPATPARGDLAGDRSAAKPRDRRPADSR